MMTRLFNKCLQKQMKASVTAYFAFVTSCGQSDWDIEAGNPSDKK